VLEHVFREGAIGPLTLPHRIVMGSMHLGSEAVDDDGRTLAAFYRERAAGGAALIVTGGSAVSHVGAGGRNYSFVNEPADAGKLRRVADAVHEAGARVLVQLFHAGRYAYEDSFGLQPVAPSAVYSRYSRCEPRALTDAEITETVTDFARGADRARELGFDGVEIMGSEGYLLNQFMAPATNLRTDAWGGDADRRMRFPLEVTAAVRAAAGPDCAVVYRISGADLVDGGASQEEVLSLAAALADRGLVDALNVGIGWHEARVPTVQLLVPHGAWRPWARALTDVVSVPVIASNRVNTLQLADDLLAAGDADFASLARPFLADPQIVSRGRSSQRVNVCIACDQACIDRSIFDRRASCVVNPRAGHELEFPSGSDAELAKAKVAVVGGGPAGMEAARALAQAGAAVHLFEAGERLGGQFRLAARIPGKEDYGETGPYFEAELARLGVQLSLGTRVTGIDALERFDAVVVATGVVPAPAEIPGCDLPHVLSYADLLDGRPVDPAMSVAIVGAGGIGVDVAHRLSHRGGSVSDFYARYGLLGESVPAAERPAPVTLMRRGARIGERVGPSTRWAVLAELKRAGVRTLTEIAYERIEPGVVHVRNAAGEPIEVPGDIVVIAAGQHAEQSLGLALEVAARPHLVIGGALRAEELDAERAFREGLHAPRRLGQILSSRP
jgi:2,4-dienoyl-CoA reductase (NADPH2)